MSVTFVLQFLVHLSLISLFLWQQFTQRVHKYCKYKKACTFKPRTFKNLKVAWEQDLWGGADGWDVGDCVWASSHLLNVCQALPSTV